MSLDYPLYEEMLRRKSRGAPWWRFGDFLYYLGLLTAMFAIPAGVGHATLEKRAGIFPWYLLAFVSGVVVFFVGGGLKRYSYLLARRDGIDVSKY
jgi:hypothetical protein